MTLKEIIETVFKTENREMHVDEIAEYAISLKLIDSSDKLKLSNKISAVLSSDIKKHKDKSIFRNVKNAKGRNRRGYYKLKRQFKTVSEKIIKDIPKSRDYLLPNVSTTYVGRGGEFSVISELLFNGFNANIMTVDEGIDVVASKGDKFFYFQVKTTHIKDDKLNIPSIKFTRFNQYEKLNTFYIIVLRYYKDKNPRNEFLVFKSSDIDKWISTGKIKVEKDKICFNIRFDRHKIVMYNGLELEDIQYYFNNFNAIK